MTDIIDRIDEALNEDVGGKLALKINNAINVYKTHKEKEGFEDFAEKNKKEALNLIKKLEKINDETIKLGKTGMVVNRKDTIEDFKKKLK